MVEGKLESQKKEYEESLSTKIEKIAVIEHELMESKETHEQTVKSLITDIDNFETDNKRLQRSLEAAKRSSLPDLYGSSTHDVVRRTSSQQFEDELNPLAQQQNKALKTALSSVTAEVSILKRRLMSEQLRELTPLVTGVPRDGANESDSEKSLYQQFSRVKTEICHLESSPQIVDLTSGVKGIQEYCQRQVDRSVKKSQLARECSDLRQKISLLAASQHKGALIETGTSSFVDPSYTRAMECRKIGSIQITSSQETRNITTKVDTDIFRKLLFVTI